MGKRGPQPKPTAVKKLEGNRAKRPLAADAVQPVHGDREPPPPAYLGPIAAAEWKRLARTLHLNSCLGDLDLSTFAMFCQSFEDWRMATAALEKQAEAETEAERALVSWSLADPATRGEKPMAETAHGGLVIATSNGNVVQNPLVGIRNKARMDCLKLAAQFGLSPSSRVGLDVLRFGGRDVPPADKPAESKAASFLNRGPRLAVSNP